METKKCEEIIVRKHKSAVKGERFVELSTKNAYTILVGDLKGIHDSEDLQHRTEDNIKMYLREIETGFIRFRIETRSGLL
jgi:hypothetical protein